MHRRGLRRAIRTTLGDEKWHSIRALVYGDLRTFIRPEIAIRKAVRLGRKVGSDDNKIDYGMRCLISDQLKKMGAEQDGIGWDAKYRIGQPNPKCDYCGKEREEEKTLELDDGKRICVLCLAGEVEHDSKM
jgi:hypothetical protein